MTDLPTGTVTFLFTDIEGSTRLLQRAGDAWPDLLEAHRALLRDAAIARGGVPFGTQGDAVFIAFASAADALAAALDGQRAIAAHAWPPDRRVRVRMGIHSGDATVSAGDYVGLAVHAVARICGAGHGGQVVVSATAVALAAGELPDGADIADLGVHRLRDLPEPERLYQLLHPDLEREFPRLRSDASPGNLPKQLTSFVGRDHEAEAAVDLLASGRLVSLTGPPGCGKTRLALEVAARLVDGYAHGAWQVDLSAVTDGHLAPVAVATALAVREESGVPLEQTITNSLRNKHLLLVLDNCEHVVEACADLVGKLTSECPRLWVLATSQEALGIAGEQVLRVPPLARADGVRLFEERASERRPGFELTEESEPAVRQICERLDGIPLAIELAAARVNVLTPQQIAARLDDQFVLLTGGSRTAMPRQQTLRAALDWSFGLLGADEQVVLRRLAVFVGGWTLEAAEAVASGDGIDEASVLDLLDRLASRSLVVVEEQDGAARYRLLETIRQYAQERLVEAGEVVHRRTRHLEWFAKLARDADPELTGPDQARWLSRLAAERGNLRAAMEWSATRDDGRGDHKPDPDDPCGLLAMAGALWRFWLVRGDWAEGRTWLDRAIAMYGVDSPPSPALASALAAAGDLATEQGDFDAAEPLLERAREIWRDLGDEGGVAKALNHLGNLARARLEHDAARALLTQALQIRRKIGHDRGVAVSLRNLGLLAASQRDFETARSLYEEALPLARRLGEKRVIATLTHALSQVTFADGDRDGARALAEEGLALARELGDRQGIAEHLVLLAGIAAETGEHAQPLLDEAIALWDTLGSRDALAQSYTTLGELSLEAGDWASARRFLELALYQWRLLNDSAAVARIANLAGWAACMAGDFDGARERLEEAVELAARSGNDAQWAASLHSLGDLRRMNGDLGAARRLYEQSLELSAETGWRTLLWWPVIGLAAVDRIEGSLDEAAERLRAALRLRPRIGFGLYTADSLEEAAALAMARGDALGSARLLGAAGVLRTAIAVPIPPARTDERNEVAAAARDALGADAFAAAAAEGAASDPEALLAAI